MKGPRLTDDEVRGARAGELAPTDAGSALPSHELVELARHGRREAFEELFRRYHPAVVRRLTLLGGTRLPVADLAQETFICALRALPRYRGEGSFLHWVLRIATNQAHTAYRRQQPFWRLWERPETEAEVPDAGLRGAESYPDLEAVHRALGRLSPRLREAVVLFELEGLTLDELAAELEVPLHTAASRVRRGRARLKEELERLGFAPLMWPARPCPGDLP